MAITASIIACDCEGFIGAAIEANDERINLGGRLTLAMSAGMDLKPGMHLVGRPKHRLNPD